MPVVSPHRLLGHARLVEETNHSLLIDRKMGLSQHPDAGNSGCRTHAQRDSDERTSRIVRTRGPRSCAHIFSSARFRFS